MKVLSLIVIVWLSFTRNNCFYRDSIVDEVRNLKDRASQLIIRVPVESLKKIVSTDGISSLSKETQYFCGICTMHGPLRVYRGKNYSRLFWTTMITLNAVLLIWQNGNLIRDYVAKPIASQVFFILPEDGIPFPSLTICSYNSVRKSYVKELNASGDFSLQLLDYIKQSYVEVETFYANAQLSDLVNGMLQYENYTSDPLHSNFSLDNFYEYSGFPCEKILKICTFGGKRFHCCKEAESLLTDLGRCYLIQLSDSTNDYLRKQKQAGFNSGLRMVADFHTEELLDSDISSEPQPFLSNGFDSGFRYFIHGFGEVSYLSHEGISVSPGFSVNTAVGPSKFILLDETKWGNCTSTWPYGYKSQRPYSAAKCKALCKARQFNKKCGCSPFFYNLDKEFRVCSPYETYVCIYDKFTDENKNFVPPKCPECKMECERWVYQTYNSYGHGFSNDALNWLHSQNHNWTPAHVRKNFITLKIAYLDMSFTVYSQVQSTSLTQVLSNVGGNMGLFLGMSVLSCAEIIMFLAKMTWIVISRKRRQYMLSKKEREEERERRLKETIDAVHRGNSMSGTPSSTGRKPTTIDRFKRLGSQFAKCAWKAPFLRNCPGDVQEEDGGRSRRNIFFHNFVENRLFKNGPIGSFGDDLRTDRSNTDQMLELKINLQDLCHHRSTSLPISWHITATPNMSVFKKRHCSPTEPLENSPSVFNIIRNRSLDDDVVQLIPGDYYIKVPDQLTEANEKLGVGSFSTLVVPQESAGKVRRNSVSMVPFVFSEKQSRQVAGSQGDENLDTTSSAATCNFNNERQSSGNLISLNTRDKQNATTDDSYEFMNSSDSSQKK